MSILPKVTSRCYAIPIKFQAENLVEINFDSKIIWKGRESRMAKSIKKKMFEGSYYLILGNIKLQ